MKDLARHQLFEETYFSDDDDMQEMLRLIEFMDDGKEKIPDHFEKDEFFERFFEVNKKELKEIKKNQKRQEWKESQFKKTKRRTSRKIAAAFVIVILSFASFNLVTYGTSGKGAFTWVREDTKIDFIAHGQRKKLELEYEDKIDIAMIEIAKATNSLVLVPSSPSWAEYEKISGFEHMNDQNFAVNIRYYDEHYEQYIKMTMSPHNLDDNTYRFTYTFPKEEECIMVDYVFSKGTTQEVVQVYETKPDEDNAALLLVDSVLYIFYFNVDMNAFYNFIDNLEVY